MKNIRILYIEDDPISKMLVKRYLENEGYSLIEAGNGLEGIEKAREHVPDLILMDMNLPQMDGYAATTKIKNVEELQHIPIVALTANATIGDRERTLVAGCDGYLTKPIDFDNFIDNINQYIFGKKEKLDKDSEITFLKEYRNKLTERLEVKIQNLISLNQELEESYLASIKVLAEAIEAKDSYTKGHLNRVSKYSLAIVEYLNFSEKEKKNLEYGSFLHDIGKIGIRESILNKPTSLNDEEFEIMKQHTIIGERILQNVKFFKPILPIVRNHHELYNGTGYPDGLKEDEIPINARIICVTDSFDAMNTNRPYRDRLPLEVTIKRIQEGKNIFFDGKIVDIFIAILRTKPELLKE